MLPSRALGALDLGRLEYHLQVEGKSPPFINVLKRADRALKEAYVSYYDKLLDKGKKEGRKEGRAQGRQEGREQGQVEGRSEILLRMLRLRFGEQVDQDVEARVRRTSDEALDPLIERIMSAQTLSEVFEDG